MENRKEKIYLNSADHLYHIVDCYVHIFCPGTNEPDQNALFWSSWWGRPEEGQSVDYTELNTIVLNCNHDLYIDVGVN